MNEAKMKDMEKTKDQLIAELRKLRHECAVLKMKETLHGPVIEQLRRSEEKYKQVYENIQDVYYEISLEGIIMELSPSVERATKYTRAELIGKSVYEIYAYPKEREAFLKAIQEKGRADDFIVTMKDKDGQSKIVSLCAILTRDEKDVSHKIIGSLRDITERMQAQGALQESEERYRSVVDNIGIGVALISPKMEILTLNNQMKKWFPHIDASKKPVCYEAYNNPPREAICAYCPTHRTMQDGLVHESVTETPAGGEIIHYRIISSPIMDANGNIVAAIEMVEDITERIKMQERLQESEQKYRSLSSTVDSMYLVDNESRYLLMNEGYLSRFEMPPEKLIGNSYGKFHSAKDTKEFRDALEQVFTTGEPLQYERVSERDKKVFLRTLSPVKNIEGETTAVTIVAKDITWRKEAERALKNRERELEVKSRNLEELNMALKVLLKQRECDKNELEERMLTNVKQLILPYLEKLKKMNLEDKEIAYVNIVESNLKDITSSFSHRLSAKYLNFTPREIQIANLIKEGKTTKEIAELLHTTPGTVDFHRDNIRTKLDLKKSKANLRSYLLTFS
jgi:PAS domain S-box-containing protein